MKFNFDQALISERELKKNSKALIDYLAILRALQQTPDTNVFENTINSPFENLALNAVQEIAKKKITKNLKYFLVIGIGGSSLGGQAVYDALHKNYDALEINRYPKLIFVDAANPEFLAKLDFFLESKISRSDEILINIISKSGSTIETTANAEFILHQLKRRFKNIEDFTIITSDPDSTLFKLAEKSGLATLPIPQKIGGRFSVFSAVGLLPLMAAGLKVEKFLEGARSITNACLNENALDNPATISAIISFTYSRRWRVIHDTFLFNPELESLGKWYRQLLAESVGKEKNIRGKKVNAGITPTVSVGSNDLHSVGQLYLGGPKDKFSTFVFSEHINSVPEVPRDRLFFEINEDLTGRKFTDITSAIFEGTKAAYAERELPFMEAILPEISEYTIGQFMQWKIIEVMLLAKLFNVNAFDQPNVEEYKAVTKKILLAKAPILTPEQENWSRRASVYQIYPRSFKDSNGDGIGDLNGIIEKLDYLNDGTENSLGIDAIWLNPIYLSPQKDFGYDISDYYSIDPVFGDLETFMKLVDAAHRRDIKIILDFVLNHTSSEHPWFLESRTSLDNPKRDWYIWHDPKTDGAPPNNWLGVFGGSAWTFDPITKQYYLHSFLASQPDLNWRHPAVKEAMEDVIKFWIHHGADGFRNDAIYHLIKDNKFRDDPPNPNFVAGRDDPYNQLLHIYSTGQPELLETTNAFCEILGEHDNKFMVSEAYLDIPGLEKLYKACDKNLHAPLNLNLMTLPWDALAYKRFVNEFNAALKPDQLPNYVLGNHDQPRIASRLDQKKARLAAMILFTLRGMPFIYYGEELGMENGQVPTSHIKDQRSGNAATNQTSRDPERTPMHWHNGFNAGFSETNPWLPIAANYNKINVAIELNDPKSTLNLYKKLIHFRKKSETLINGAYRSLETTNNKIFAFVRETSQEKIITLINFSDKEQKISLPGFKKAKIVCNSFLDASENSIMNLENFTLRPNEGYILKI